MLLHSPALADREIAADAESPECGVARILNHLATHWNQPSTSRTAFTLPLALKRLIFPAGARCERPTTTRFGSTGPAMFRSEALGRDLASAGYATRYVPVEGETAVRLAMMATGPAFGTPATPSTSMEKVAPAPMVWPEHAVPEPARVSQTRVGPMAWNCAPRGVEVRVDPNQPFASRTKSMEPTAL